MGLSRNQFLTLGSFSAIGMAIATAGKALSSELLGSSRATDITTSLSGWTSSAQILAVTESASELMEPETQINLFQAIALGFVQGMTEFIPISSTAHLQVIPVALGWGDPGVAFTAILQLGSIGSVLWYFWPDLSTLGNGAARALVRREYEDQDFRIVLGILIGSLPIILFGLIIKYLIPEFYEENLRTLTAIGVVSILMAILLGIAERFGARKRTFGQLSLKDGLLMGLAQVLALVPGFSRSGSTITAGLFMGLDRTTAARFSFLLGIPAITSAGLVELKDLLSSNLDSIGMVPLVGGLISSAVFSYLSIAWLLNFLKTQSNWVFIWYRIAFGSAILFALALGWIQP
ncbi:undecaprenyl-diphosphate phosphatase [Laspinema olomoucense]|uniref:undecaprenyl-diphosphate phosphatase n=1 Tax=Laspinema olomoucense TaxID=3231600 RepID=UPI0021BAB7F6|nr:undecaprenyl-diphosphate phosphatase [Laspinema sp. D3c]MCT7997069.1 undecaprenyl-diphosphate phosphatase [Laspinema sp. D3c]